MKNEPTHFSLEEYKRLKKAIEDLEWVNNMQEMVLNISTAFKILGVFSEPTAYDADNLANETFGEKLVLKLLLVISDLQDRHNGSICLPELPIGTETLTSQEKLDLEARMARERAMYLMGGKKDIQSHRKILKEIFESADLSFIPSNKDRELRERFKKTFEALDATLEADIQYMDFLTSTD